LEILPKALHEEFLKHRNLLLRLQAMHDKELVSDWEISLFGIAEDYNLIYTPQS
jgi:hypothetical protein